MSRLLSWVSADVMPMISKGPTVYQASYGLLRERLGGVLGAVVESGPGAVGGLGSVPWRACAALYSLVEEHPVDRRGRCRSCRRPGALLGWVRRRCQVRVWACFWLHQPDEALLLGLLARELDEHPASSPGAGEQGDRSGSGQAASAPGLDTTDVLPRIDLDRTTLTRSSRSSRARRHPVMAAPRREGRLLIPRPRDQWWCAVRAGRWSWSDSQLPLSGG